MSKGDKKSFSMLELLTKECVRTNVEAKDWKEAVRKVGEIMVEIGAAEPRYIDAMIKTVKEMGPYIVITKGIAIPHGRPEEGTLKLSFVFVKLKKPVEFGNPDNDPVDILIGFTATESGQHVKAIAQLAKFLQNSEYVEKMRKAKNDDELYQVLLESFRSLEK